ncbi:MAG: MBL fold metallo-hydrolase [Desulfurobacteriaceae bacterium]
MGVYNVSPDLDPKEDIVLYDDGKHKVVYLGSRGISSSTGAVDVLSYLVVDNNEGLLIDPGGYHLFSLIVSNVSKYISLDRIKYIYFCHQDPDVCGSLPMWKDVCPEVKIAIGELWTRFLPHFGVEDVEEAVYPIPAEGGNMNLGKTPIDVIPAHYLHSPNHFSLYDPVSKFLFTGDIGIALGKFNYLVVKDWVKHLDLIYLPHRILMCSNKVSKAWAERVKNYEIKAILPQHGAIIPEEYVKYFIKFMENLKCGVDLLQN